MIPSGLFITATGTEVGKTFVTRGIARGLVLRGRSVAAIKPIETGCQPSPADAAALSLACGRPHLTHASGLYRAELPLAPYAISLKTGRPPPDVRALAHRVAHLSHSADVALVEGAGGLLVPLDAKRTIADLALAVCLPLLVVAPDALGVLSHCLTLFESALARGLDVSAVVLVQHDPVTAPAPVGSNRQILQDRLPVPVLSFPHCTDDNDILAQAAASSGLLDLP